MLFYYTVVIYLNCYNHWNVLFTTNLMPKLILSLPLLYYVNIYTWAINRTVKMIYSTLLEIPRFLQIVFKNNRTIISYTVLTFNFIIIKD